MLLGLGSLLLDLLLCRALIAAIIWIFNRNLKRIIGVTIKAPVCQSACGNHDIPLAKEWAWKEWSQWVSCPVMSAVSSWIPGSTSVGLCLSQTWNGARIHRNPLEMEMKPEGGSRRCSWNRAGAHSVGLSRGWYKVGVQGRAGRGKPPVSALCQYIKNIKSIHGYKVPGSDSLQRQRSEEPNPRTSGTPSAPRPVWDSLAAEGSSAISEKHRCPLSLD